MLYRRARAAVFISSLTLVFVALALPADAASVWTPPERLDSTGLHVDLAASSTGDAVAVWNDGSQVLASFRPAGRAWHKPVVIDRSGIQAAPSVVMDRHGNATAVWDGVWRIVVAYRPAGRFSEWQIQVELEGAGDSFTGTPVLAGDATGRVAVAFSTWVQMGSGSYFAHRGSSGGWELEGSRPGGDSALAVTPGGVITSVWQSSGGLMTSTSTKGRPWTEPVLLMTEGGSTPQMASDSAGNIVVATSAVTGLRTMYKPAGRPWEQLHEVTHRALVRDVAVGIDERGRATVVYIRGRKSGHVMSVRRLPGGRWTRPVALSRRLPAPYEPAVAGNFRGKTVAVWMTDKTWDADVAQVAHRTRHGRWRPATDLSTPAPASQPGPWLPSPSVVALPNGTFTTAFIRRGVELSDFVNDAAAPTARMVRPR